MRVQLHVLRLLLLQRRLRLRLVLRLVPRAFPAGRRAHAPRDLRSRVARAHTQRLSEGAESDQLLARCRPGLLLWGNKWGRSFNLTRSRRAQALYKLGPGSAVALSRSAKAA